MSKEVESALTLLLEKNAPKPKAPVRPSPVVCVGLGAIAPLKETTAADGLVTKLYDALTRYLDAADNAIGSPEFGNASDRDRFAMALKELHAVKDMASRHVARLAR